MRWYFFFVGDLPTVLFLLLIYLPVLLKRTDYFYILRKILLIEFVFLKNLFQHLIFLFAPIAGQTLFQDLSLIDLYIHHNQLVLLLKNEKYFLKKYLILLFYFLYSLESFL